ncbi:DNA cytosine methyltransferase [Gordonia alkanivorans]|uniref:DNA cytosine methyltransferase n=1 Tax=Gordonia alkanivorans TaxID=84096 RepID=UPI0009DD5B37|nr:DNA (cytosine-5-)-methyltransferase [Gordonia alkanivorans]MDH3010068.1 DNA (cytosine-5-)-methyltransferase [Gordonia alkanivorans]
MRAVGLFSGIGGFELGLSRSGISTTLLCENWGPAVTVLASKFDAEVVGDITTLQCLPAADVVTAGFPCTDLSQVGRKAGIDGNESGLVKHVFRLVEATSPKWLVLENVPNMLTLHGGAPMRAVTDWLQDHRWNWAYRVVDSRYFGVRQRRRRVLLVASKTEDPRTVLFSDDAGSSDLPRSHHAYGFYWTEGNRGLGWGEGVTPTLKGGSKLGIASPPAVWRPGEQPGAAIVRPSINAGERLQGFRAGWTSAVSKEGIRWKLVGNAVTVPVAAWIGRRLVNPAQPAEVQRRALVQGERWPVAASWFDGRHEAWNLSERPLRLKHALTLSGVLDQHGSVPLSFSATAGFTKRLEASTLRRRDDFVQALHEHMNFHTLN